MGMKLYEISAELERLERILIDPQTGELDEDVMAEIDSLEIKKEEKLEDIGILIKSLTAEVDALVTEKKALEKRIKPIMNKIEWLCSYANNTLQGEEFKTSKVWYHYRQSSAVIIDDEDLVPDELVRCEVKRTPVKTEIKKLLKAEQKVPGCHLEERMNLNID